MEHLIQANLRSRSPLERRKKIMILAPPVWVFSYWSNMRFFAYCFVLTSLTGHAFLVCAADIETLWQPVSTPQSEHVHFYVDKISIRQTGKLTRARVLYDFAEPQFNEDFGTYSRSYVVDSYIDCTQGRLAPERMTIYAENKALGKAQGHTTIEKEHKWAAASPGTINGAIAQVACKLTRRK
jgi:hypothetical protein